MNRRHRPVPAVAARTVGALTILLLASAGVLEAPTTANAAPTASVSVSPADAGDQPVYPDRDWGAIAVSPGRGNTGYTWDHASADSASGGAIARCGASDCQTVVVVSDGCAALAQASNRALGWAYGISRADAESGAIGATPGRGAHVISWTCTTGHQ